MTTAEMIAVMQAYEEGKKIQYKDKDYVGAMVEWEDIEKPQWDLVSFDYRIKPEEEKEPERMTNRQLAEWCLGNNGQLRQTNETNAYAYTEYEYLVNDDEKQVSFSTVIRPWDSDAWLLPTVDIYERDCKGAKA